MSPFAGDPGKPFLTAGVYRSLLRATAQRHPEALFQVEPVRERAVALTIDDGPGPRTPEILDLLRRHDCRATFFVHTAPLERDPGNRAAVVRMLEAGHEVANHMPEDRPSIFLSGEAFAAEFTRAHETLTAMGSRPRFFRPSRGFFHAGRMLPALQRLAYYERFVMGSYLPWDVFLPFPGRYAQQLAAGAFPGAIFVLHDGGEGDRPRAERTLRTLALLLPLLARRGYRLEPLGRVLERAA